MEAALFIFSLVIMFLLLIWAARSDAPGKQLTGLGLFDPRPGAPCDHRRQRSPSFHRED